MPLTLKLAIVFLILPFILALVAAPFPNWLVQRAVEAVIGIGVLAAVVGIPFFIIGAVLQALNPPGRGGS